MIARCKGHDNRGGAVLAPRREASISAHIVDLQINQRHGGQEACAPSSCKPHDAGASIMTASQILNDDASHHDRITLILTPPALIISVALGGDLTPPLVLANFFRVFRFWLLVFLIFVRGFDFS